MGNLSWASPKSSKSTSTRTSNDRGRYRTYSAPMPKKAKPKPTPKAKKPNQNNNQRANLPSEVAKQYAQPARTRPATPITSAAKASPGPVKAKVVKTSSQSISAAENTQIDTAFAAKRTPKIKTTMGTETTGYGVNNSILGATGTNMMASLNSTNPLKVSPTSTQAKSVAAGAAYKNQPKATGAQEFADPTERAMFMLKEYQNTPTEDRQGFNESSYDKKAVSSKDSIMPTVSDKYRNNEVSYNQAYWKAKLDGKTSQADMAAEQKALGSKKIYSGDRAITEQDQSVAKQTELYLKDSGIKPTVENMKKGFFGETMLTNSSYDIGTGKNILTSKETTSPTILGFRFGDDITKSSVNGVNTYVKTGQGDTQKTESAKLSASNDRVEAGPDPVAEMKDIDNQIKNETDPVKLKALYQRRLRLMRMNRTNTRFAGLLGEPDTKRTNLMSIS